MRKNKEGFQNLLGLPPASKNLLGLTVDEKKPRRFYFRFQKKMAALKRNLLGLPPQKNFLIEKKPRRFYWRLQKK
jgi:hypothetical protein